MMAEAEAAPVPAGAEKPSVLIVGGLGRHIQIPLACVNAAVVHH